MEKVPEKPPVEFWGTRVVILASVAVLLLVGLMFVGIYMKASNPTAFSDTQTEAPVSRAGQGQDAPRDSTPQSGAAR